MNRILCISLYVHLHTCIWLFRSDLLRALFATKVKCTSLFSYYNLKSCLNSPICIWWIVSIYNVNNRCNLIYFHINIKCLFSISKRSFSMRSLQFVMLKFFFGQIHYRKNILCWAPWKGRYVLGIVFAECKTLWSALGIHLAWGLLNVFMGFWKEC